MADKELIGRLERLERENRRLKRAGLAMLLGMVGVILLSVARAPAQAESGDVQRIAVRNPVTGSRAVLDGDGLTFYDASGRIRVELRQGKTGPKGMEVFAGDWLKLYDDSGRPGVELTEQDPPADFVQGFAREQSTGNLVMLDYEGKSVSAANLGVGRATGLWLTKTHLDQGKEWPAHNDVNAAIVIDGGSAGVQVKEHGNTRIGLFSRAGMAGLDVADAAGYETQVGVADLKFPTSGETSRTSAASIVMLGSKHRVIWRAP
ncbi:MAG TPA: hypothetical protein VJW77_07100 [Terriglobia bacterium]|nr:hypothetical protein [Terriglobia bacterium]